MFNKIRTFFKKEPAKQLLDTIQRSKLLIHRLNEEENVQIPKVITNTNTYFLTIEDEINSLLESILLISKKIEIFRNNYEIDPWFDSRLKIALDSVFSIYYLLDYNDRENFDKFIIDFYRSKPPSTENIEDIRDKLREMKK